MVSGGIRRCYSEGARLSGEITLHTNNSGGVTVGIYGSKGSGKTTLMLTLTQIMRCVNPFTGEVEPETIYWRGRRTDYWTWLPKDRTFVFFHKDDINRVIFKDDLLMEIPKKDLPPIIEYDSCEDLYRKTKKKMINVIYEPSTYEITKDIREMIRRRGVVSDDIFRNPKIDPVIFWFEFANWLVKNKSLDFISIIFDEADEILPQSPAGPRWHLNLWMKDVIKDFRKRNISMFLACHGYQDIDGRIFPKIQYKIYMKGCITPSSSLVNRHAPLLLSQGKFYIERDAWGMAKFKKIKEQPRVLVEFEDEYGDLGDEKGESEEEEEKSKKRGRRKKEITSTTGEMILSDRVKIDKDGNVIISVDGGFESTSQPVDKISKSGDYEIHDYGREIMVIGNLLSKNIDGNPTIKFVDDTTIELKYPTRGIAAEGNKTVVGENTDIITLPYAVERSGVRVSMRNGILELSFDKKEGDKEKKEDKERGEVERKIEAVKKIFKKGDRLSLKDTFKVRKA